MVGTSKILTVSYGTFSCTLEGFDDSFSTMKAIAEYFRGLAADDRYFGAEPPTPDAELLAKIAEREISRRVDARMDDGEIVLRAAALSDQSGDADTAPEHDQASRAKVEAERKAAKAARKAEKEAAKAARKAEKAAAAAKAKADAEAKAEAEKAEAMAKAQAEADAKAEAQAREDAKTQVIAETTEDAQDADEDGDKTTLSSESAATADASEGTPGSDVEETRGSAPSSMLAATDPAPEETPDEPAAPKAEVPAHPDADSVAAKLQRICAVVGNSNADADDSLTAQVLPKTETPDVSDVVAGIVEEPVEEAPTEEIDTPAAIAEEPTPAAEEPAGGMDMIARVMARQSEADVEPVAEDTAEASDDAENAAVTIAEDDVPTDQLRARVVRMKRADFEKAFEPDEDDSGSIEEPSALNGPDFALLDGADELDEYLEDSDFTDAGSAITDQGFADDLKALVDQDSDDDDSDEPIETTNAIESAVAEAAHEDSAAVEDEVVDQSDDDLDDETPHGLLSEDPQVDDSALDRLMDESEAQMKEPEGSRRRDAIAQLKAAVAAKEAARQVGEPEDDDQDVENAFRNDLSEAVRPDSSTGPRPRPVVRNPTRTERPRPAPLKLVAAQRVDLPETERRDGPVVPRRVAARKDDPTTAKSAGSFAEFADNMGATELPDLLEAAAAYTSFVEGADEFSRPQILRRVRAVASDDFNREDGLRSFADLLRAGRFTKVRNGRFQVADDSRFNPERRAG